MKEQTRHHRRLALSISHTLIGAALVVFVAVVWITDVSFKDNIPAWVSLMGAYLATDSLPDWVHPAKKQSGHLDR